MPPPSLSPIAIPIVSSILALHSSTSTAVTPSSSPSLDDASVSCFCRISKYVVGPVAINRKVAVCVFSSYLVFYLIKSNFFRQTVSLLHKTPVFLNIFSLQNTLFLTRPHRRFHIHSHTPYLPPPLPEHFH